MPPAAYAENWLYELIDGTLEDEFDCIDASLPPQGFLNRVPTERRLELARKGELHTAVDDVVAAYVELDPAERGIVRQAQREQRDILALFDGEGVASVRRELPPRIRPQLANMADRAYEALDALRIRDRSYKIHADISALLCAFCGYEAWDQPSVRTMDWDHYLARSLYPFAAMNLKNLSPMGSDCNRHFKNAKDILRSNNGQRRACFDPYTSPPPRINLLRTELFAGTDGKHRWVISYAGDPDRCASWDSVFKLDTRWTSRLDRLHDVCLDELANHFRKSAPPSLPPIIERLRGCQARFADPRRHEFLKGAIFELWLSHLGTPSAEAARLLRIIRRAIARVGH